MARAARVCPSIGCSNIVSGSDRYCESCSKDRERVDNARRNPENKKIYSRAWQKIRADYLKHFPFCVDCGELASEVDHLIPIKQGGTHDHENLRSRCKKCHSRKTAKNDGGFGNPVKKTGVSISKGKGGLNL